MKLQRRRRNQELDRAAIMGHSIQGGAIGLGIGMAAGWLYEQATTRRGALFGPVGGGAIGAIIGTVLGAGSGAKKQGIEEPRETQKMAAYGAIGLTTASIILQFMMEDRMPQGVDRIADLLAPLVGGTAGAYFGAKRDNGAFFDEDEF